MNFRLLGLIYCNLFNNNNNNNNTCNNSTKTYIKNEAFTCGDLYGIPGGQAKPPDSRPHRDVPAICG